MKETLFVKVVNEPLITYNQKEINRIKITNSEDVYSYMKNVYSENLRSIEQELFYIVFVDNQSEILGNYLLSCGGVSATIVDLKIMFRHILSYPTCTSILISHNHPSGNIKPSVEDKSLTKRIKEACKIINFCLLDHVIYTPSSYFSFADNGEL